MKDKNMRLQCLILSMLLLVSSIPFPVFAQESTGIAQQINEGLAEENVTKPPDGEGIEESGIQEQTSEMTPEVTKEPIPESDVKSEEKVPEETKKHQAEITPEVPLEVTGEPLLPEETKPEEKPSEDWPDTPQWVKDRLQKPNLPDRTYEHKIYGVLKNALPYISFFSLPEVEPMAVGKQIPAEKIVHTTAIYVNGKEYTGGDIQVTKGDHFSYSYAWQPVYGDHEALGDGDWFEFVLFKIPKLSLVEHVNQPLVINGIKVGNWTIHYNKNTGEMKYRATFNRYINMFDLNTIRAQLQGSGTFSETASGTKVEYQGQAHDLVILDKQPIVPSMPSGQGWKPPVPQFGNKTYHFGKGVKWNSAQDPSAVPQIDWRIVFFNFLQMKQEAFFKGEPVTPTQGYCILEEKLDENQSFHWTGEREFGGTPFHLELPVLTVGTDQLLNGSVGYGGVNGAYDGPGKIAPYIRGADLKEFDGTIAKTQQEVDSIRKKVKETPCSWTVTTDPKTKRQSLLINLGVLGGTDSSKGITWSMARGDSNWPQRGIQSKIKECDDKINAFASGAESPITLLDQRHQMVVNLLIDAVKLPINAQQVDYLEAELAKWRESYRTWRDDKRVNALAQLEDEAGNLIVPLPDLQLLKQFEDVPVNGNGALLKNQQNYQNFIKSFSSLRGDQKTYLNHRMDYKERWKEAKARYEKTLEFYETSPIFGFSMKCRTKSINTSMKQYQNEVTISIGDHQYTTEDNTQIQFSNSITGNFGLGSFVLQKADQCYDVKTQGKDEQQQEIENIKKVEADQAGIGGAKFQVYCAVGEENRFVKSDENLARFLSKEASPRENAYIYTHTGPHSENAVKGDVIKVETDQEGKLALEALTPKHDHFLVETDAPQGYYVDETPIRIRTKQDYVTYDLVPNISRSVKLQKIDSYTKLPIQGTEFALFRKDSQNQETRMTGFIKKMRKGNTLYIPDEKGRERLFTNEKGELCIHNLEAGTYVLKELQPAGGYLPPKKEISYTFTLEEKLPTSKKGMDENYHLLLNQGQPVENEPGTANLELKKIESHTKGPLAEAGFGIFRFMGTEEEWNRNPNQESKWQIIPLQNKKSDEYFYTEQDLLSVTEEELPGATTTILCGLTDMQGKLKISNIPLGHYSIGEMKAPDTYQRDYTNYYFDVDKENLNQSVQIYRGLGTEQKEVAQNTFKNDRRKVFLKLVKGDAKNMPTVTGTPANHGVKYEGAKIEGKGLAGAVYKLFMKKGSTMMDPNPEELKTLEIVGTTNKEYDTCIAVGTTDQNGVLDLKDMTDAHGNKMSDGIHMEKYYMIEIKPPKGYVLDQIPIIFQLDSKVFPTDAQGEILEEGTPGLVKTAENVAYDYGIRLIKKDATDQSVLKGVGFQIYKNDIPVYVKPVPGKSGRYMVDTSGSGKRMTMQTNQFGALYLGGLEPGTTYSVREIHVPNGYREIQPFTITTPTSEENGMLVEGHLYTRKEILNERLLGKVFLHKQDEETGIALEGAKFQLYRQGEGKDEMVGVAKATDTNGNLTFEQLEWGDYYLREVEAPKGYVLSVKKLPFTIGRESVKEGDFLKVAFPYVTNSKHIGEAILRKIDRYDPAKTLKNATFTLWKKMEQQGEEQWIRYGTETRTTDAKGEILFKLPPGTYKVVEVKAPEGYLLPTGRAAEKTFVIEENQLGNASEKVVFDFPNEKEIPITGIRTNGTHGLFFSGIGLVGMFCLIGFVFRRKRG